MGNTQSFTRVFGYPLCSQGETTASRGLSLFGKIHDAETATDSENTRILILVFTWVDLVALQPRFDFNRIRCCVSLGHRPSSKILVKAAKCHTCHVCESNTDSVFDSQYQFTALISSFSLISPWTDQRRYGASFREGIHHSNMFFFNS